MPTIDEIKKEANDFIEMCRKYDDNKGSKDTDALELRLNRLITQLDDKNAHGSLDKNKVDLHRHAASKMRNLLTAGLLKQGDFVLANQWDKLSPLLNPDNITQKDTLVTTKKL